MATWEDHTRDNLLSSKVASNGQGLITLSLNLVPGQIVEVQQLNLYTINHGIQGASIMKGVGTTSQIICTTPVTAQVSTPTLQAAAAACAIGPPYVYLQPDELITGVCWGGTSGDLFYMYVIYRLGFLYNNPSVQRL